MNIVVICDQEEFRTTFRNISIQQGTIHPITSHEGPEGK
jgi:hypothetical protein